jgi:hypothetical protein
MQTIPTTKELIQNEVQKLIQTTKTKLQEVKSLAISEAWKTLELAIATVVQIIEAIGNDLSSPEKKELAMGLLSEFYDKVFHVIVIPGVPSFLYPILHKYIKSLLMLLVSSSIDAIVTTFRSTGIFLRKA